MCRLSLFCDPNDETRCWIAVSQGSHFSPSHRVLVYDETKECVNRLIGVSGMGLETISNTDSSLSSNSIVVSGGERKILAFDSVTSDILCEFPDPPVKTFRISHFPEWNRNRVFVGGMIPDLSCHDLNQECVRLGEYRAGHWNTVEGLSASLSHGLLLSGSGEGTLESWSFNQFDSCVHSVELDKGCYSVKYLEDLHLICCGTIGEIEIWDIRNLSQRVRKVTVGGLGLTFDLDQIETNYDSSDPVCVSGAIDGIVSSWNPISGAVLQKQRCRGSVNGVRFRGNKDLSFFCRLDEDERIHFLMEMAEMAQRGEDDGSIV